MKLSLVLKLLIVVLVGVILWRVEVCSCGVKEGMLDCPDRGSCPIGPPQPPSSWLKPTKPSDLHSIKLSPCEQCCYDCKHNKQPGCEGNCSKKYGNECNCWFIPLPP